MASKIIQKEKEQQEKYIRNRWSEAKVAQKRCLINLKEHMEEGCGRIFSVEIDGEISEFNCGTKDFSMFVNEGIGFPPGTTHDKSYCSKCQENIKELNKMIERYG